jgi:hypothetical protein
MKSFETSQGPKQQVRDSIVSLAKDHIPHVHKILTLPGREALCVKTFQKHFPNSSIRGIERNKEDWQKIVDKGIDCIQGTVQDYASQVTSPTLHHDIVFLDYFSFFNKDVLTGIEDVVWNPYILHADKPTILGITLAKAIRHEKDEMLDFIRENIHLEYKEEPINNLDMVGRALLSRVTTKGRKTFSHVETLNALEYSADKGSSLMYFFCFKLVK